MEMRSTQSEVLFDRRGRRIRRMTFEQRIELRKRYAAETPGWRRPLFGYIISVPLVAVAIWSTLMLRIVMKGYFAFPGSVASLSVLFVALFWGVGPSLFAIILNTVLLGYFFIPVADDQVSFVLDQRMVQLLPFVVTGLIIALITAQRERERLKTLAAEQELQNYAMELEEANQKLEDANQTKDRFMSIASHELKTPITTIRGQAQLALRRLAKQQEPSTDLESVSTSLERINEQTGRLTSLIDELMDVSSIRAGKAQLHKRKHDLSAISREVAEDQHMLTGRAILIDIPPNPIKAQVDGDRISQVLVNLISNAVKYSPERSPVEVTINQDDAQATIMVRDHGKGISKEQHERIFETFYRTPDAQSSSKQGLGLGLAISKEIVERHNGRIWVESAPDQGSIFFVELPLK
jgi:signal transduction histidine kinase